MGWLCQPKREGIHIHTPSAEPPGDRPVVRRSHEIHTEIAISRHEHSHSHLAIHIHTSSAECRSDRSCIRRSHEIDTEISISQHDHSRSHLTIHIHTSSAECRSDRSCIRRSREVDTEIAISRLIASSRTFLRPFSHLLALSHAFLPTTRRSRASMGTTSSGAGGRCPRALRSSR